MPKYLIEGSCDGGLFGETIEANSQADAEAFAIERLCEAWGEEFGPDTTLDDLGDCAVVTEYSAADYARDAAPDLIEAARAIVHQRDYFAETGIYDATTFCPDTDQQFDDWAADILEAVLSRVPA